MNTAISGGVAAQPIKQQRGAIRTTGGDLRDGAQLDIWIRAVDATQRAEFVDASHELAEIGWRDW